MREITQNLDRWMACMYVRKKSKGNATHAALERWQSLDMANTRGLRTDEGVALSIRPTRALEPKEVVGAVQVILVSVSLFFQILCFLFLILLSNSLLSSP